MRWTDGPVAWWRGRFGSLALLDGAFVTLEVAGVCVVLCFSLDFGHAPLSAGFPGALSGWRCTWGRNLGSRENSLGWGGPHLPDRTPFALPWPGSLHLPGRLGPGFVPTGEAWQAQACAWSGLGGYRAGREWLRRRLGCGLRQRPPLGGGPPPYLFPASCSPSESSFVYPARPPAPETSQPTHQLGC